MSDQSPLIVPMTVEAFVVNDSVRTGGNTFLRAQMNYNAMQRALSGQPGLGANNDPNFTSSGVVPPFNVPASDYYNGVYPEVAPAARLHAWRAGALPDATTTWPRSAQTDGWSCATGRRARLADARRRWMIESDYPGRVG